MNKIISDILKMPDFEALKSHHPGVTFEMELEPALLNIKGSPVHLHTTVMNLLNNAAEAIDGSGIVTVKTENRYVDRPITGYEFTKEGEYVTVIVADTGIGISAADLERVFEPFYTKKIMGRSGTGLGLTVVWGTVKDHDGYIDVQSEVNGGSIFTLYLPATREALSVDREAVSRENYLGRGERILVVDDVEGQRLLAVSMLSSLGYRVDTVASGEAAVEYLHTQPADLVVLDMIMEPGIDGLETYKRIKNIRPRQKAVIVSGFTHTERVRQVQEMGAGEYIRKPYLIESLGLAVRREIDCAR
jgi:CheY-like chemotaxis protein